MSLQTHSPLLSFVVFSVKLCRDLGGERRIAGCLNLNKLFLEVWNRVVMKCKEAEVQLPGTK